MLTLFSVPKPFRGHINIIQRNAIQSWLKLSPKCEVILFGDDEGVVKTAEEFGILHIPEIEKNEFGTPLLNSAFNLTQKLAKNEILVYINADNILMSDFISAIKKIKKPLFLMSGRRWDSDVKEEINFDNSEWEKEILKEVKKGGKLHPPSGMDYCIFTRSLHLNFPPFAVGRPGWDNWLIYHIRSLKIPVIDATEAITVVHQTHDYFHSIYGEKDRVGGPESKKSLKLAGGFSNMMTLRDADWVLTPEGLKRPSFPGRFFSTMSRFYLWRLILAVKRKLQSL